MKALIKSLIPPLLLTLLNKLTKRTIRWSGDYKNWEEAASKCVGYDPDIYLAKLIESTQIVRDDESKCERDSIVFDEILHPYALLSNLFAASSHLKAQSLYILDFGGSLGSLYYQNRKFLRLLPHFTWNILEQDKIIQAGKEHFQTQELCFHTNIEEAKSHIKQGDTKVLILSGVMQYLPTPYEMITELLESFDFDIILLDRTAISKTQKHRITIQEVPRQIYRAAYPCHAFAKAELLAIFLRGRGHHLLDTFDSYCDESYADIEFKGFAFVKKIPRSNHEK